MLCPESRKHNLKMETGKVVVEAVVVVERVLQRPSGAGPLSWNREERRLYRTQQWKTAS